MHPEESTTTGFRFVTPPHACSYLPSEEAVLEYEYFREWTATEYQSRMQAGWRRFGRLSFHPICPQCNACKPLRVDAVRFQPSRSQHRAWLRNEGEVELRIGEPSVTRAKMELHYRFHSFQSDFKNWPQPRMKAADEYYESFVDNPFPVEEWSYFVDEELLGVGYVDVLPEGLSAIYFFYNPDERGRSLGTYNVLKVLERAKQTMRPYVYLGYFVDGCRSMAYKATFRPNEIMALDGRWLPFRVA